MTAKLYSFMTHAQAQGKWKRPAGFGLLNDRGKPIHVNPYLYRHGEKPQPVAYETLRGAFYHRTRFRADWRNEFFAAATTADQIKAGGFIVRPTLARAILTLGKGIIR